MRAVLLAGLFLVGCSENKKPVKWETLKPSDVPVIEEPATSKLLPNDAETLLRRIAAIDKKDFHPPTPEAQKLLDQFTKEYPKWKDETKEEMTSRLAEILGDEFMVKGEQIWMREKKSGLDVELSEEAEKALSELEDIPPEKMDPEKPEIAQILGRYFAHLRGRNELAKAEMLRRLQKVLGDEFKIERVEKGYQIFKRQKGQSSTKL
jgi:hypothetical protein